MARARNIKPGFFTNDILADCDPLARLLFIGLWCMADREGRLEDRPKKIKAEVLPYDTANIDKLLSQLIERGFLIRYSVDGAQYLQINKFTKHQNPHMKEAESTIPAPDSHGASMVQETTQTGTSRADSGFRIPDSQFHTRFAAFWDAYPKKKSKGEAETAFKKIKPDERLLAMMLEAIGKAKTSADWLKDGGQFIPYPATWLNKKCWEDQQTEQGVVNLEAKREADRLASLDPEARLAEIRAKHAAKAAPGSISGMQLNVRAMP